MSQEKLPAALRLLKYKYSERTDQRTPSEKISYLEESLKGAVDEISELKTRLQEQNQLATELAQHLDRLESQRFNMLCNHHNLKRVTSNERDGGFTFWF